MGLERWHGNWDYVANVLSDPEFLKQPHEASRRVWEFTGRKAAANGGVMRTSVLGVWDLHFPEQIRQNAEDVCRITHYDPRCVASCVAGSLSIAALVMAKPVDEVLTTVDHRLGLRSRVIPTCGSTSTSAKNNGKYP